MSPIILSGIGAVIGSVIVGKFTRFWVYNGSHSLLGSIILVSCIAISLVYGSFDTIMSIAIGCLLSVGVAMLISSLGRAYDKFAVNTHISIALLLFGVTFLI